MKKKYNTALLSGGIAILLSQIAAFVLQDYFGRSYLTLAFQLDTFIMLAISFILILQFKSFDKFIAIILVIYGAFNLIHGVSSNYAIGQVVGSLEVEVMVVLGLLIGHALFEISALFILLHSTQPRFETKFTKKFVLISLIIALVLFSGISVFLTQMEIIQIVKTVGSILAIGALYITMYILVEEKPVVEEKSIEVGHQSSRLAELERLYQRGIITKDEYESRKSTL